MPGNGPPPKVYRGRRAAPARGEWKPSPQGGWQHPLPAPPTGLRENSSTVWLTWFKAWWAAHWTLDDLPGLRLLIYLYDRVLRGDMRRLGELRQLMDSYGITPKGQQDRRWLRPEPARSSSFDLAHRNTPSGGLTAKQRFRDLVASGRAGRRDPRELLWATSDPRPRPRPTEDDEGGAGAQTAEEAAREAAEA